MEINNKLKPSDLLKKFQRFWKISAQKITLLEKSWNSSVGSPVFTVGGKYTAKGWTEWTQGFQFGSAILQFDATGDESFLNLGREKTVQFMSKHVTHIGVHDHGFNNISTYGNLRRLMNEGRIEENQQERNYYELALKCSGAVQAQRWTNIEDGGGYIYSFSGPHSLFADTIRSLRILAVAHQLGHILMGEKDRRISLLERLIQHVRATAKYSVYYGQRRDVYDIRGRVAHESIFNLNNGNYRCPNSQQGFSPFSTWTRGLAWIMLGFVEQLEFIETLEDRALEEFGGRSAIENMMLNTVIATCEFYIENSALDGIVYWDTDAPSLHKLGDYQNRPADPYNNYEPVDSSASAIAAQALIRLGCYLKKRDGKNADEYFQAGLTVLNTLLDEPYLSIDEDHQGLILHSIYHRPNGWDYIPNGSKIPCGESSMWGDYHVREAALLVQHLAKDETYYTFFG